MPEVLHRQPPFKLCFTRIAVRSLPNHQKLNTTFAPLYINSETKLTSSNLSGNCVYTEFDIHTQQVSGPPQGYQGHPGSVRPTGFRLLFGAQLKVFRLEQPPDYCYATSVRPLLQFVKLVKREAAMAGARKLQGTQVTTRSCF